MATKTSYSHARENLATLWDEVEDSREAAYLLRSPENAVRVLSALMTA